MNQKETEGPCCSPIGDRLGGCRIEAVVSIDERGQMVLPKEMRDKAGIRPGDKLALISMQKDGKTCCLTLVKVEEFAGMVKDLLGPVMAEVLPTK
ncbi:MAG TPA: HgcAB-associated protein [Dehalococcoidales bacterium]|nr:MAG: AbrB family transcriptional regulator [Chloroflexi bacterium RBG_16_60_22]HJX13277.1 HgcAB-associated protein [Dehalococcoidales bacterium]